jgi:hypothetical protein
MKMLDLINESETDAEKNLRHQKDLDDLERSIRKSGAMDKDTEDAINKKRKELKASANSKADLSDYVLRTTGQGTTNAKGQKIVYTDSQTNESTTAGAVASVATPVGGVVSRQNKNSDGTVKNALDMDTNIMGQKKKPKSKKA